MGNSFSTCYAAFRSGERSALGAGSAPRRSPASLVSDVSARYTSVPIHAGVVPHPLPELVPLEVATQARLVEPGVTRVREQVVLAECLLAVEEQLVHRPEAAWCRGRLGDASRGQARAGGSPSAGSV